MRNLLIIFTLCLSSLTAYAFEGNWRGTGTISSISYELECSAVAVDILRQDNRLIMDIDYNCPHQQVLYPATNYKIVGDELFIGAKKVGSFTQNEIHITKRDGPYNLWLRKQGDTLHFRELLASRVDFTMVNSYLSLE